MMQSPVDSSTQSSALLESNTNQKYYSSSDEVNEPENSDDSEHRSDSKYSGKMADSKRDDGWIKKRYLVTLLICLGTCVLIMLQLNLSITIVQMTSAQNITSGNQTIYVKPEFDWSQEEKGLILSVSSYGILLAPVGGLLANKFGGATVFGWALGFSSILTFLTPVIVRWSTILFVIIRFLEGIPQGIMGASLMEVFIRWTPPNERSRLIVNGINGYYLGATISHPICGFIAEKFGWQSVFFTTGSLALVWVVIWTKFVSNCPADDKYISKREKTYLMEEIPYMQQSEISVPWKQILKSKPVWALLNEFFTLAWSYSMVVNSLPLYINDVQHQDIENIGFISSIPNICSLVGAPVAAFLGDFLRSKRILSAHYVYKTFISFGQISATVLLIVTSRWMNFEGSIICLSLFRFCFSFAETSYEVLPADLAGRYASLVRRLSITTMAIGFILSPTIMGFMVSDHSRASWNRYFMFLSIFNVWSLVVFLMFGSGETQSWAKEKSRDECGNNEEL